MFTTKQALGDKLPSTRGSFLPALERANFRALVGLRDGEPNPVISNPVGHSWYLEEGVLTLIMKMMKNRCSPPCKCLANDMPCTEMCNYNADKDTCDNLYPPDYTDADSDESDGADL
ncbi:hypothetical protein JTB14_020144 [Gonioctena quinquepunctata]|nr:hypothetical protein JTB14_020144 [Gonioctena quinquepunctata]